MTKKCISFHILFFLHSMAGLPHQVAKSTTWSANKWNISGTLQIRKTITHDSSHYPSQPIELEKCLVVDYKSAATNA